MIHFKGEILKVALSKSQTKPCLVSNQLKK